MTTADVATDREPRSSVIARRTRGLIAELQLEQRDLAARLGMSQPNMSRKVNGRIAFTPDEVEVLAPLLGVREDYLYGFTNDRGADERFSPTPGYLGNDTYAVVLPFRATRTRSRTLPPMPMPPTTPGHARPALRRAS